jgi:hypothetical protein
VDPKRLTKMIYSKNSGYGMLQAIAIANGLTTFGKFLVVMPSTDANYDRIADLCGPDNDGDVRLFSTLELAYAAATTNANDVIFLSANSTHSLSAGIAWAKNRIHVIGLDGGDRLIQQGAKVQNIVTDATAYVIKVTGVRNSFRNVKFIQISTVATALHVLEEGGEGNLYKNCSFTFGVADNLDLTTANEVVAGSDSATFISCEFGTETLLTSGVRSVFKIDQVTSSQEFKSNRMVDCNFVISSSETTATLISTAANTDVLYSNLFKNCTLVASIDTAGGVALAVAAKTSASLVKGILAFHNCAAYGCTNFASDAVGNDALYVYGGVNTGTDLVGVLAVAT